jgi:polyhydroxyalkanoate synthesis regulator phasin
MEQADLEERVQELERSVKNLLGQNPVFDEWIRHIRKNEDCLNQRIEALERRIAKLEPGSFINLLS